MTTQGIFVRLTPWEILLAAQAGLMRQVENIKLGRKPYHGAGSLNDWQLNIEGCLGEYALAKYLGVHWSGKGDFRGPDVGGNGHPGCEVRVAMGDKRRLILHPEDGDNKVFWLVCGVNGSYRIKGWILGQNGKKEEWWTDPTGKDRWAFFVPQAALNDPESWPGRARRVSGQENERAV